MPLPARVQEIDSEIQTLRLMKDGLDSLTAVRNSLDPAIEALGKMLSGDARIPVVLNTAYGIYKDNFMSWAADAYVVKSADMAELKATSSILRRWQPEDPPTEFVFARRRRRKRSLLYSGYG